MTNLAMLYSEGLGVSKDDNEAVRLLTVAASKKHARAQLRLADFLLEGRGVDKSAEEAFKWYKLAADEGNSASAMYQVGDMLENGVGCEVDEDLAIQYYERGAMNGDVSASERLIVLVANHQLFSDLLQHGHAAKAA